VGEVIFLCLFLVIVVFIHLMVYFIDFHQAMKISFVFAPNLFFILLTIVKLCGWENPKKTKKTKKSLFSKP
jgi:hypothetical protein